MTARNKSLAELERDLVELRKKTPFFYPAAGKRFISVSYHLVADGPLTETGHWERRGGEKEDLLRERERKERALVLLKKAGGDCNHPSLQYVL